MNKRTLLVLCAFLACTTSQYAENMEVSLEQGRVRGFLSDDGRRYSFLGIPYATVPKGDDKYKAPLPPRSWTDTMEATDMVMCTQIYFNQNDIIGTEECLVVNIFIPVGAQVDKPLPVFTFIHGGGFYLGFGDNITGRRLLDQDIIIVTMNYRLGALGFLCLGTEDIPGNAGLKDQVAAMHWIRKNIPKFGGNPDDVTLYGSSGGSISVDILSLSRAAEGLFHRIILESGVGSGWIGHDPVGAAKTLAEIMGHSNVENVDELVEIYKRATVQELVSAMHQHSSNSYQPFLLSPCVENDFDGSAIITDSPMNILRTGNFTPVPAIVAYMDMEGLMFLNHWNLYGWDNTFHENFAEFVLHIFSFESESERNEVAENMRTFYLQRSENDMLAFVDYQTDTYFFYSSVTNAILRSALSAPVYLLEFSHHDSTNALGADHSDMYLHVFEIWLKGAGGELAADRITNIFGNFIKYGEPVPSTSALLPVAWPRVTSAAVNYMSFAEELSIRQSPEPERYQFWSDIHDKYYTDPTPPNHGSTVSASVYSIAILLCTCAFSNNIL